MASKDPNEIPAFDPNPDWTPPVEAPKGDKPDPVAELKAQLDRERQARVEAERRANEYAQTAHGAQVEMADNQMQLVVSAIERVRENTTALKAAYAEAMRSDDFDSAAEIQSQMADNSAKLLQLENGKAAMESQPKPRAPETIRTVTDPVEDLASQLTPKSAAWVRAHPECARDKKLYAKMIAAHNIAVANDIEPDTDRYFKTVENLVYEGRSPARDDDDNDEDPMASAAKAVPTHQTAPPAAPVSRGSGGRTARLSPAEREAAEISGMTEEAYAAAQAELRKAGRLH